MDGKTREVQLLWIVPLVFAVFIADLCAQPKIVLKISDYQEAIFPNFHAVLIPSADVQQLEIVLQGASAELEMSSVRVRLNDRPMSTFVSVNPIPRGVRTILRLSQTLNPDLRLRAEGENILIFEALDQARTKYYGQFFLAVTKDLRTPKLGAARQPAGGVVVESPPSHSPPKITIKSDFRAAQANEKTWLLDAHITDEYGIRRVVIEVNGKDLEEIILENDRPIRKRGGFRVSGTLSGRVTGNGKQLELNLPLEFKKNLNSLVLRAENTAGLRSREEAKVDFEQSKTGQHRISSSADPGQTAPLPTAAGSSVDKVSPAPVIEILEPAQEIRQGDLELGARSIAVRGRALAARGIFSVTINQRTASLRAVDSQSVEFWLDDVLLRPGHNQIIVVATATDRTEGRLSFGVKRPETEVATADLNRIERWALVVGISRYGQAAQGIGNLKYARRDAEAFYEFLRTPDGGGFAEDHILVLIDERATSSNLRGGIRDFLGRAGENDLVFIYFAGHGTPDLARPGILYLLTYDSDPARLGATAFDMDEIKLALAKNITARRVVAFVDACHSAGVGTVLTARSLPNRIELVNRYLHELARSRPGVVMVTASQTNETSWEGGRWGHGVFTYYLLDGLRGAADRNLDAIVTLQELIDFVGNKVKQETDYKQHPTASTSVVWDPNLPMSVLPRQKK